MQLSQSRALDKPNILYMPIKNIYYKSKLTFVRTIIGQRLKLL